MNVGLDFYGTIEESPAQYWALADNLLSNGDQVYIVTAIKPENVPRVQMDVHDCRVPHTAIEIIEYSDYDEIPLLKLNACDKLGIELFVDDREDTCALLKKHGILALHSL